MISRASAWVVRFIGILLLIFAVWGLVEGLFSLKKTVKEGLLGINYFWDEPRSSMMINYVGRGSAAEKAGVRVGDRVMQINNVALTRQNHNDLWGERIEGTTVQLTIKRREGLLKIAVSKELTHFLRRLLNFITILFLPFILIAFSLAGILATFKFPGRIGLTAAGVCLSLGTLLYTSSSRFLIDITDIFSPFMLILQHFLFYLAFTLFPLCWLLFAFFLAEKADFSRMKNRLLLVLALISTLSFLAAAILSLVYLINYEQYYPFPRYYDSIQFLYLLVYLLVGFVFLGKGGKQAATLLKRRRYHLLSFGLKFGIAAPLIGGVGLQILGIDEMYFSDTARIIILLVYFLGQVGALTIPYTFHKCTQEEKLVEAAGSIKRKVWYSTATLGLFLVYLLLIIVLGNLLVFWFNIQETSFTIFFTLLVAITFYPLNQRFLKRIEERIYPERSYFLRSLKELVFEMRGVIQWQQMEAKIARWFQINMGITPVTVTLRDTINSEMQLNPDSTLSVWHRFKQGKILFWDEMSFEEENHGNDRESKGIAPIQFSISVPMMTAGEMVGLLNLGKKKDQEDYTGDDIAVFKEAAEQTAPLLQNLKHQSEQLEKERLTKEMEVARRIQEKLMPQSIPDVKGVLLYGASHPCLEVGGDYYDMIDLEGDKVVLAAADVCGKGAGAALLMANLQAALRVLTHVYPQLPKIVGLLNHIIHENTPAGDFITLFVGKWDNSTETFEYINAGHPPALWVKNNGQVERLTRTGIALGLLPDSHYSSVKIKMGLNDLLAIYTDGIEETFNAQQEIFGVQRISEWLVQKRDGHPREITHGLLKEVRDFSQGIAAADDATLVMMKRVTASAGLINDNGDNYA